MEINKPFVIPAQAGIHGRNGRSCFMDPRLRGDDVLVYSRSFVSIRGFNSLMLQGGTVA